MSDDKPKRARRHTCWVCGAPLGEWDRYSRIDDTCGQPDCEREARNAAAQERQEAHDKLDRDRGWS